MENPAVQYVSDCFIKPKRMPEESRKPLYLSPWDLKMVTIQYMQKGLFYAKPSSFDSNNQMEAFLKKLKDSLSLALVHFYPLAGRLATQKQETPPSFFIYVDFLTSPGARFIYATLNCEAKDVLAPTDVPEIMNSLFDHSKAINYDGHTMSLLTIQVTELIDSIFIGCSINHMICDGSSFWHFFNSWSEIFKANGSLCTISRPPVHKRFLPEGHDLISIGPFTQPEQFISRFQLLDKRVRIFHLSFKALSELKAKANAECNTTNISTLQALSAHIWRCTTRVQNFSSDQKTLFEIVGNNRSKINPPLSENYFGNCVNGVKVVTTIGELLGNGLGWAAWRLHQGVINRTDQETRKWVRSWAESPSIVQQGAPDDCFRISVGSSPRFNMYGNEFELGKVIAVRSGQTNKSNGKVTLYPGIEGDGSMDMEICLSSHILTSLESHQEFMETIST